MQMLFNSPISSEKANNLIDLLELSAGDEVIDVGCGTGEFLTRVVERTAAIGTGVDIHAESLEIARTNASKRITENLIEFRQADIQTETRTDVFDCGICMGATHAFAMNEPAYPSAITGLCRMVRPGGKLLIGESFWMKKPEQEYLDFIAEPVGTYRTHPENVELAKEHGLVPYYSIASNLDEWDDFEWRHNIRKEKQAATLPEQEAATILEFSRTWRMAYLKWGRGTMGFAFYIFVTPSA